LPNAHHKLTESHPQLVGDVHDFFYCSLGKTYGTVKYPYLSCIYATLYVDWHFCLYKQMNAKSHILQSVCMILSMAHEYSNLQCSLCQNFLATCVFLM